MPETGNVRRSTYFIMQQNFFLNISQFNNNNNNYKQQTIQNNTKQTKLKYS